MTAIAPGGRGPIVVLSIDGGGVKGLIPAVLLRHLERDASAELRDLFSVFTGTSTGGILAAVFARDRTAPVRARTMVEVYETASIAVFPKAQGRVSKLSPDRPISPEALKHFLDYLGDARLADARCEVALPAFDLGEGRAFLLTREEARRGREKLSLRDAVKATAAAPTYLPPVKASWAGRSRIFVDGGVFACNPTLLTVAALRSAYPRRRIRVLSLDCGSGPTESLKGLGGHLFGSETDRTNLGWARRYLQTATQAMCDSAHQLTSAMLPERDYLRVSVPYSGKPIGLDHADQPSLRRMHQAADRAWANQGKTILEFLSRD